MDTKIIFEKIRKFAEESSLQLANDHAGNPVAELNRWLLLATEREQMARKMYDPDILPKRVKALMKHSTNEEMVGIIRFAIECIWSHEEVHTVYLASIARLSEPIPPWSTFLSKVKGRVIANLTLPESMSQEFASLLLHVVVPLGAPVPEFVSMMADLKFRDFCRLNSALEDTAVGAYSRMLDLNIECETAGKGLNPGFNRQVKLFILDEQSHREIFRTISDEWLVDDDQIRIDMTAKQAVLRLKEILEVTNRLPSAGTVAVDHDYEAVYAAQDLGRGMLLTDAGLKPLFDSYGISLPLLPRALALELIEPRSLVREDG